MISIIGIIKSYTIAHPYLLADNRHYTFYIWRKIITRTELSPIFLAPIYVFAGFSVLFSLRRTELVFKLAFPVCVVINLLPQYLLEFRYFVIPFILHRLQFQPQHWWTLCAEMAFFQVVSVITTDTSDTWNELFVVNWFISNFFWKNTKWKKVSFTQYLKILIKLSKHGIS